MMEQINLLLKNEPDTGKPYVFLPLYNGDIGVRNEAERRSKSEFSRKHPVCITDYSVNGLTLNIRNSGQVASDMIIVEYQVIYCVLPWHGVNDAFTSEHSGVMESGENYPGNFSFDFIPPLGIKPWPIKFKEFSQPHTLANIYFRAKVATLWHEPVPINEWNFANDVTVTEFHLDFKSQQNR